MAYSTPAHKMYNKKINDMSVRVYPIPKCGHKSCLCNEMRLGCWAVVGVDPLRVDEDPAHLHQNGHLDLNKCCGECNLL